jgi:hypothetical protein
MSISAGKKAQARSTQLFEKSCTKNFLNCQSRQVILELLIRDDLQILTPSIDCK